MHILVINCGSSSVKFQLFDMRRGIPLMKGIAEKIGGRKSVIVHQKGSREHRGRAVLPDYFTAIERIAEILTHPLRGAVKDKNEIRAVGHRVVHGAEEFRASVIIGPRVLERIKHYAALAPLHNPPAYNGIKAAQKIFSGAAQAAVFDTAFHQTMPPEAFFYALPYELYRKYGIRRYGFHGTSHRYVAQEAAGILGRPLKKLKLITCHLGNGCSITAVCRGKSVDTSMGFTPLEGLVMGTRCGDIDPALAGYLMEKEKLSVSQLDDLLNRKSGLLGLSGVSNDMRDILEQARAGNERARLALDVFVYRVKKYIGAYIAAMNGADAVALTGGIGENASAIKTRLKRELSGFFNAGIKLLTIHTDEEQLIAADTYALVRGVR